MCCNPKDAFCNDLCANNCNFVVFNFPVITTLITQPPDLTVVSYENCDLDHEITNPLCIGPQKPGYEKKTFDQLYTMGAK